MCVCSLNGVCIFVDCVTQVDCRSFVLQLDCSFVFSLLILQGQPCKLAPVNEASLELLSVLCMEDIMLILWVSGPCRSSRVHYYNCQTWLRMLRTWTWNQQETFFSMKSIFREIQRNVPNVNLEKTHRMVWRCLSCLCTYVHTLRLALLCLGIM